MATILWTLWRAVNHHIDKDEAMLDTLRSVVSNEAALLMTKEEVEEATYLEDWKNKKHWSKIDADLSPGACFSKVPVTFPARI